MNLVRVAVKLVVCLLITCFYSKSYSNTVSPIDSLKVQKDTGSIISITNTKLAYNFTIYPNNNYGQEYPNYVHRFEFSPVISIAGLQFNSNINLSSEDFTQGRNLNRINISFDKNGFQKALKKYNTYVQKDNIIKKIDSLNNSIEEQKRKLDHINEKLENKEYLEKIENAKAIKARSLTDSNYLKNNSERVNQANFLLQNEQVDFAYKNNISGKIDSLRMLKKSYQFISNLNGESAEAYVINKSGKIQKLQHNRNFLNGISTPSRFELFDVSPNWSPLFLNGITLRGGIIEYNQRNIILGFTGGFVNSINWYDNVFNKNSYIYSGRIGYGNFDKNNIIFTYLKGNNANTNAINQVKENDVLGIQLNVKITENHLLFVEKAWSNQSTGEYNQGFNEVMNSTPKTINNSALFIKYNGNIIKTKTKIESKFRLDDLYFYSMGSPSNRKDALKFQLSVKQVIYKNIINVQLVSKIDKDNLSETKFGTTTIISNQGILNIKINKSNLKFEGQKIVTTNTLFSQNLSEITIANISLVKPYKLFHKQIMTVGLINYVYAKTLFNDTSNTNYLLSLNNSVNLSPKVKLNLNYSGSIRSGQEQGKYSNTIDLNYSYSISKYTYSFRYAYLNISELEDRNSYGISTQINYSKHINTYMLCNYDYIVN